MAIIKSFFGMFWTVIKWPFYLALGVFCLWLLVIIVNFVISLAKGKRLKKGSHKKLKKVSLIRQIFWDAPKMIVKDMFDTDPDFFPYQGLVIYTGRQGQGKTIAMVRDAMLMQQEYPLCKCITNLSYKKENAALKNWRQLITYKNGIYGVIVCLDEIQNWFSSKQSKDFPPEMFEVVTQNRKNRRVILATTQNFYQPAKDIRAQCTEVRKCMTLFGVFTVVHAVRPVLDSNGDVKEWRHIKFYTFVHSPEIRDAYDTYKVIESLVKSGFQERKVVNSTTNLQVHVGKGK